jgi:hypothetical protein
MISQIKVPDDTQVTTIDLDVFEQLSRIYNELLKSQVELDPKAREALYSNLWELYT